LTEGGGSNQLPAATVLASREPEEKRHRFRPMMIHATLAIAILLLGGGLLGVINYRDGQQAKDLAAARAEWEKGQRGGTTINNLDMTNINASNISSGTLANARLSDEVTLQGNTFNGPSQLVQLTADGLLPVLDGSNLTNLDIPQTADSLTITAGDGLSGGGEVALGGSTTLDVVYGAAAGTAVQGNTSLTCASGTGNLAGGGNSITLGSGGVCSNISIIDSPTFTGTVQAATINATTAIQLGGTNINTGGTLSNVAYLDQNNIFTGTLTVQSANSLTLGLASTNTGAIILQNSTNANTLTLLSGATAADLTLILPTADGGNGQCLQTNGTGTLSFQDCTGGPGGGVTSLNGLTGILTLQGTANQIIVSDNGVNTLTLSLPQDIATTSSPTFATVNATTGINTGAGAGTQRIDSSGNLVNIGTITTSGTINTATISGGTLSGGNVSGGTLTATAVNSLNVSGTAISGTGALTIDANGADSISIGGISTGDILLGGGSGSTGCTVTNATGDLACSGNITGAATGTAGYWTRAGTTLSPATVGDSITTSGNISTTGTGTITSAGLLTGNAGLTVTGGTANVNVAGTSDTSIGNATGTLTLTGDSGSTIVLNGTTISAAELNLLDGHDVALVDTNDAVNTAITGTGALTSGSIATGFGTIATANTITGTTINGTTGINTGAGAGTQRIDASGNLVNIGNITASGTYNTNTFTSSALQFGAGATATIDANGTNAISIGGISTGDILFGGGSASTGCTVTNATGDLACSGNIIGAATGTAGYWTRAGTTLSPATAGDNVTTTGKIAIGQAAAGNARFVVNGNTAGGVGTEPAANSYDVARFVADDHPVVRWADTGIDDGTYGAIGPDEGKFIFGSSSAFAWRTGMTAAGELFSSGTERMLLTGTGRLELSTTGTAGGLVIGGDTNLYRSGVTELTTNGNILLQGGSLLTNQTTANLFNTTATTLNIGGAVGAGGIVMAGGSGSTGCTLDGSNGNFTCSGNITGAATGTIGYWTRAGTTLSPATAGDSITTSGNIYTTGSGRIGINDTSPDVDLDIQAQTASNGILRIDVDDTFNAMIQLWETSDRGFNMLYDADVGQFILQTEVTTTTNDVFTVQRGDGSVIFRNSSDSTGGFRVRNATGESLLTVDTTNGQTIIAPPNDTGAGVGKLVINSNWSDTSGDEAQILFGEGADGGLSSGKLYYTGVDNIVHLGALSSGGSTTDVLTFNRDGGSVILQSATGLTIDNDSANNINITPNGGSNTGVVIQPSNDSTAAFSVQNAAGTSHVLDVNTTNGTVSINATAPTSQALYIWAGTSKEGIMVDQDTSSTQELLRLQHNSSDVLSVTSGGNVVAGGSSTATTATTSGTGTNTTTLTFTGTTSFANNDILFIDNAGQDYYTRIVSGGTAASVTVSPAVTFENARTVTKYNVQNIGSDINGPPSSNNSRYFQGYFTGGIVTGAGSTTYSDGNISSAEAFQLTAPSVDLGTSSSATSLNVHGTTILADALAVSGEVSGGGITESGGAGAGASGDTGGGGGGAIGGGTATDGGSSGDTGGQAIDVSGLFAVVTDQGFATTAPGAGGTGSTPTDGIHGGNATGFGSGGGGAGFWGGNGGNGLYGGGGGGASGFSISHTGGAGGQGVVVISPSGGTNAVKTSGTTYTVPAGITTLKIWTIGAGGGGAGAAASDGVSGGAGGAGGVAYRVFAVKPGDTISYSLGTAGTGGSGGANGNTGGNTTVTAGAVTLTANGGAGGVYNTGATAAGGSSTAGNKGSVVVNGDLSVTGESFLFQSATNSDTAFQIQNTGGTSLFTVDTSNDKIKLANSIALEWGTTTSSAAIAQWHMNEASWNGTSGEVVDSAGNYDGTAQGNATTASGHLNNAGTFDGASDYVSIPNDVLDLSGDFTVSMWINLSSTAGTNPRTFAMVDSGNSLNLQLGYTSTNTYPFIRVNGSSVNATQSLGTGSWKHVVYKMEGGTRTVYINNTEYSTSAGGPSADTTFSAIGAGGDVTWSTNGLIDEVQVYSEALSDSEVSTLYNSGSGTESTASTVVADTNLYRSAASTLKTDDTFDAAAYKVGGVAGASATCAAGETLNGIAVSGGIVTAGTCTVNGADLAEAYNSTDELEAGELVMVDPGGNGTSVLRANGDSRKLMGVVSTHPDRVMGTADVPNGYPIALSGRVPTKVSDEGGAIEPGDKITLSSAAGVGMKANSAGMVVGTALTGWNGPGEGTIEVFVHVSYYQPPSGETLQSGSSGGGSGSGVQSTGDFADLNVSGTATISTLTVTGTATIATLNVSGTATFNGNIILAGSSKIVGNDNTRGEVVVASGETTKTYTFPSAYDEIPNVVVTPTSNLGGNFWVSDITATGFTVHLGVAVAADVKFNFQAQQ
jgi:hypothetical protein